MSYLFDYRNCDGFAIDDVSFAEMNQGAQRGASNIYYLEMILRCVRYSYDIIKKLLSFFFLSANAYYFCSKFRD